MFISPLNNSPAPIAAMSEMLGLPPYLHRSPSGSRSRPPVATRPQALPFSDLAWIDFERLILRLVRTESDIEGCYLYGVSGQKQDGIDIFAIRQTDPDHRVCYQCKRVAFLSRTAIRDLIDLFLRGKWARRCAEFVLCTTSDLSNTDHQDELETQRRRLLGKGVSLSVWDSASGGDLSVRLKSLPALVDDFFGRPWVEIFNGKDVAAELSDRLDGYDLTRIQARLSGLYEALFARHDPGLTAGTTNSPRYRSRYVPAAVTEWTHPLVPPAPPTVRDPPADMAESDERPRDNRTRIKSHGMNGYESRRPVLQWLKNLQHCVVIGQPGYGKSILLRYLALSILKPDETDDDLLDPDCYVRLPMWVSFSRFSNAIRDQPVSVEEFFRLWLRQNSHEDIFQLFARAARNGQIILLVDGLDEAVNEAASREALDRVVAFVQSFDTRVVCTTRPRGYSSLGVPNSWKAATLTPLSDEDIVSLAARWLSGAERRDASNTEGLASYRLGRMHAEDFLRAVQDSPKTLELSRSPLLCQALIELFRYSHQLPEARVSAYRQIVELLLTRHPAARAHAGGIDQPIRELGLTTTDLQEILSRLAWELQAVSGRGHLDKDQCQKSCAEYLADDTLGLGLPSAQARREAEKFVDRLLTRYGILVERAPGELGFLHLSIQEYLAAEFLARESEDTQLSWLERVWATPSWRESVICWFGILGQRGNRSLAVKAFDRLAHLAKEGAWQRMLSLELRAEIATADVRIPVKQARDTVREAASEVEVSPFSEFRTTLARSLTIGAIGSHVQTECQRVVRRWIPGRPAHVRAGLLRSFKDWHPSSLLRDTLLRALHDEDPRCRHTAAETLAGLSFDSNATLDVLTALAFHDISPAVRAAAITGLRSRPQWSRIASDAAQRSLRSCDSEVLIAATHVRVSQAQHDNGDMRRLWRLWTTDSVDFWFYDALTDLFCAGWPESDFLRDEFIDQLSSGPPPIYDELGLEYLITCFPNHERVLELISKCITERGIMFPVSYRRFWNAMRGAYHSHPVIAADLRRAAITRQESRDRTFWEPNLASAFVVIGDDAARDLLLSSYEESDQISRYWIIHALLAGWSTDVIVRQQLLGWANGAPPMASPLARWATTLFPDADQRKRWLFDVVDRSRPSAIVGALISLIKEFPTPETRHVVAPFLNNDEIMYYDRMDIQARYARAFSKEPESLEIVNRALHQIEGPPLSTLSASYQSVTGVAERLLSASVTAPTDVRMEVGSTLRARTMEYEQVTATTPDVFAEQHGSVRTNCLLARAQAARRRPSDRDELAVALVKELSATGPDYASRRGSAIAALIELGLYSTIADASATIKSVAWRETLIGHLDQDPVATGKIVDNWKDLQAALSQDGESAELPVEQLVYFGYSQLIERTPWGRDHLDRYLAREGSKSWIGGAYVETLVQRMPKNEELRRRLLSMIYGSSYQHVAGSAARLLIDNYSSSGDVWPEISERPEIARSGGGWALALGVIGYMVYGWPDGALAKHVRGISVIDRAKWSPRDRLLVSVAEKNVADAEAAAEAMLSEPLAPWTYKSEDTHALHKWAQSHVSSEILQRWIESDDPTRSLTAISLCANGYSRVSLDPQQIGKQFNEQLIPGDAVPRDGLDAGKGRHSAWAVGVYSTLGSLLGR